MAVQVAQASDPSVHPTATATAAAAAYKKDEMLSPVSKLEAARKQAAIEQQKRVEEAVARMATVKSENAGKRKLLEEKLDAAHAKAKVQKTSSTTRTENKRSAAVATSTTVSATATAATVTTTQTHVVESVTAAAATLSSATETTTTQKQAARKQQTKTVSASYDATAELLRATRNKLNDLVGDDQADGSASAEVDAGEADKPSEATADGDWNGPSTNYHLKQLGLVKKKIDIYAPVEAQQQEIRRLRDRSRFVPKLNVDVAEDQDSENDSDFSPEAASASASDEDEDNDDDSDAESIPEVEPEEALELAKESAEHEQALRQQALLRKLPLVLLLVCLAFVLALAGVEVAQQQLQLCPADAPSDSVCGSFLQTREQVATTVSDAWQRGHALAADSIAAARASFSTEL